MFIPIGDNVERRDLPIVTPFLVWANLMVFGYQLRILYTEPAGIMAEYEFIRTWGLIPQELAAGNVVGLLTHMFLHGGIMHFLGNMVVLWAFACTLEEGLGKTTLLGFYLLFGIAGGLCQAVTDLGSDIPSVGASGAIAGLIGAYTVMYGAMSKIRCLFFFWWRFSIVHIPAAWFGGSWFLFQVWESANAMEADDGIGWWAHIGGFLSGVAVAALCRGESEKHMVETKDGEIRFQVQESPSEVLEELVSGPLPMPAECPYCLASLQESNRLADNLARCPNSDCKRLLMLESPLLV